MSINRFFQYEYSLKADRLKEYHELVSKHRATMFHTAWWQQIWTTWPPQEVYEDVQEEPVESWSEKTTTLPGAFPLQDTTDTPS